MDDNIKLQLIQSITFLINDNIGVLYSESMWEHNFKLIFKDMLVEITLSHDLIDLDLLIYKDSGTNRVGFIIGDPGVNELISTLKSRFSLDNSENIRSFINEVDIYKNNGGDGGVDNIDNISTPKLKNLELKLNNFIKTEQFEKAEEIKKKIKKINQKKK